MSGVERSRGRGKGRGRGRGRGRGQEKDGNKEKRPGRSHRDQSGYEDRESMRPATNRSTGPPSDGELSRITLPRLWPRVYMELTAPAVCTSITTPARLLEARG